MNTDKQLEIIKSYLETNNIFYRDNYHIKYETYFKMGGNVKIFITPQSYEKFKQIVIFLQSNNIKYKLIGFTSNIILFDEIEYSVIISIKNLTLLEINDNVIQVEAGYSLQDFVRVVAILNNSEGYEGLEGIPASIGGAILMNAGAYGYAISNNLISVECIDKNNKVIILEKSDCHFGPRNSIFRRSGNYVILKAKFEIIKNGDKDLIARNIEKFHIARHLYQDFVYPNLGSMISVTDDAYKSIFNGNIFYTAIYWILKYAFKNPFSKFIMRKRPSNLVFNKLLLKYLKTKKISLLRYTLSRKSANILINDGSVSTKEMVDYLFLMSDLIGNKFHIENELVIDPAYKINPEFETTLNTIRDRLNSKEKN